MMEIPREIFILSAIMFTVLSVNMARKALKEKTKLQYITLLLMVLSVTWSILAAVNQIGFAAIAWGTAMIVSIINLPEAGKHIDQQLLEVDLDSPITPRDIISSHYGLWVKVAYRYGIGYAILGYIIQGVVVCGGILLVLDHLYGLPSNLYSIVIGIVPVTAYQSYRQIEKRLAVKTNPTEQIQV